MVQFKLAPSIFAANVTSLKQQINVLEQNNIDMLHIDVMDGLFVNRMAYGADHIKMIKECTSIPLDVHLMILRPERYLDDIIAAGADIITVHEESTNCLYRCLQIIKSKKRRCAVALSPATNPINIKYLLNLLDMVLIMTVNPGAGKQPFIPEMSEKIRVIKQMIDKKNIDIEVDGSIDDKTISICKAAGANIFVSGGYVFNGDIKKNIDRLRKCLSICQQKKM